MKHLTYKKIFAGLFLLAIVAGIFSPVSLSLNNVSINLALAETNAEALARANAAVAAAEASKNQYMAARDAAKVKFDNCFPLFGLTCTSESRALDEAEAAYAQAFQKVEQTKTYRDFVINEIAKSGNGPDGQASPQTTTYANQASDQAGYAANSLQTVQNENPETSVTGCEVSLNFDMTKCLRFLVAWFAYLILTVCAYILGIAGYLLNLAVDFTILKMKVNISTITGINIAWKTIRDVANMMFIFVLLYAGISTIINGSGGQTGKMLRNVIIAALLINFSLFFTKIMIDASNVITIGFYNGIVNSSITSGSGTTAGTSNFGGLADSFLQPLGVTTFYAGSANWATQIGTQGGYMQIFSLGIMGSIFLLVTAFSLLIGAILLIVRFVVLIVLMILSPLAFAGSILPQTKGYSNKWWKALGDQATFAPIYMLMVWVVIKIVNSPGFTQLRNNKTFTDAFSKEALGSVNQAVHAPDSFGIVINFLIVIFMLNAAVIIAKSSAGSANAAAAKAINFGERYARRWTTGLGTRAATTAGSFAGRNTVGYAAKGVGKRWDNLEAKLNKSGTGRSIAKILNTVGGENVREGIEGVEKSKFGGNYSLADREKKDKQREALMSDRQKVLAFKDAHTKHQAALASGNTGDIDTTRDVMERAAGDVTNKQLEELYKDNPELLKANVQYLNTSQLQHVLEKVENMSDREKEAIVNARLAPLNDLAQDFTKDRTRIEELTNKETAGTISTAERTELAAVTTKLKDNEQKFKDSVRAMSGKEIELVGNEALKNNQISADFFSKMSGGQHDDFQKNNAFTRTQKDTVKGIREKPLNDALEVLRGVPAIGPLSPAQTAARKQLGKVLSGMSSKDVAKKRGLIENPEVIAQLTPNLMKDFVNELTEDDLKKLGDKIKDIKVSGGIPAGTKLADAIRTRIPHTLTQEQVRLINYIENDRQASFYGG